MPVAVTCAKPSVKVTGLPDKEIAGKDITINVIIWNTVLASNTFEVSVEANLQNPFEHRTIGRKEITIPKYPDNRRSVSFTFKMPNRKTLFVVKVHSKLCGSKYDVEYSKVVQAIVTKTPKINYSYTISKKKAEPEEPVTVSVKLTAPEEDADARVTVSIQDLQPQTKTVHLTKGKPTTLKFEFKAPSRAGKKDVHIKIETQTKEVVT